MGTNGIVKDILETFIKSFDAEENIDRNLVNQLEATFKDNQKITSQKIEQIIYEGDTL